MNRGWTYKKLGLCYPNIKNGANIKQVANAGGYPITRIETLSGGVFNRDRMGYADVHDLERYKEYVLEDGDLLMSHINSKTYIGRTVEYKVREDEHIIHGMNLLRLKGNDGSLLSSFFAYYTQSNSFKSDVARIRKDAVNQSSFAISDLKDFEIPVPSTEEQKTVIEELDAINALVAIKEKQLRELEELEQTIFHEMFGDPIDNEKGWNVDSLSNLCEVFAGGDKPKNLSDMQSKEFPYPVIANGDGVKGILGYSNSCRVKEDAVTIGARGSIGNCRIVKNGFTPAIRLITLVPKEKLNCYFLYFFVRNMDYRINGVAQAQLTVPNIEKENILVPPIALQLHFAEKMQEIEILKDNLSTVKRDLEELLASRMQYWFD